MKLEIDGKVVAENASAEQIARSLATIDGVKAEFAILSRDEMTFMQTSGSPEDGFSLEYADGTSKEPYHCPDDLNLEQVVKAFQSYAGNGQEWRSNFPPKGDATLKKQKRKKSFRKRIKINTSPMWISVYAFAFLTVVFGILGGREMKGHLCSVLCMTSMGLLVGDLTTITMLQGSFRTRAMNGATATYINVTPKDYPFRFWSYIAGGYAFSFLVLVAAILFWLGKIG